MNEDELFRYKDALFMRNLSLSTAVFFSISFILLVIGISYGINQCIENGDCKTDMLPIGPEYDSGWGYFILAHTMISMIMTYIIMIFLWKYTPNPIEQIYDLEKI